MRGRSLSAPLEVFWRALRQWSRDVWRCPPEQEARFGSDANRGVPSWCSRLAGWSRRPGMTGGKLICSATPRRWSAAGGRTRRVHRTGALDRPRKRPGVARERFPFRRGRVVTALLRQRTPFPVFASRDRAGLPGC